VLFKSETHQEVWIEHHCQRCCHHNEPCLILARALRSGRKPKEWQRNNRAQLMVDSYRCDEFAKRPPKPQPVKLFEDVPMFDVEPCDVDYVPVEGLPTLRHGKKDTDHA
jgi:hypothetical protein